MTTARPGPRRANGEPAVLLALATGLSGLALCVFSQSVPPAAVPPGSSTGPAPTLGQATPSLLISTAMQTALPTPTPIIVRSLTSGGCCAAPFWGPDSQAVYFLDRSPSSGELGIFRVDIKGSSPTLVFPGAGVLSNDLSWAASVLGGQVSLTHLADGVQCKVPSDGRLVGFSPQSDQVYWQIMSTDVTNVDRRRWNLSLENLATRTVRSPIGGVGGGFVGWGQGQDLLLFSGRQSSSGPAGLWASSLDGSERRLLFKADRITSPLVSPLGGWVALTVAFSATPDKDGLWLVPTDGSPALKLAMYGSYRWRDEGQLLIIPLAIGDPLRMVQVDAHTGASSSLIRADEFPQSIADNTWAPSPDGAWVVYRSGEDGNLWILALPEPGGGP